MKRFLAIVMSLVVVFGICVVGTGCNPNKETEAEYKARIKKELDEIPVEATGYKLVDPTKQEVTYPEGEKPIRHPQYLKIDGHKYTFSYHTMNDFDDESLRQWWRKIVFSIDDEDSKPVIFSDNKFFEHYQDQLYVYYYDKKFFIVRFRSSASLLLNYSGFYPPILFHYDIERNVAEYIGYSEAWFDYKIEELDGNSGKNDLMFTIVKT